MKGDPQVIDGLNEILTAELTAINQYYIHAKMCENWGYQKLYAWKRKESIEEMKDADAIIERILYLDGVPNMQRLNPVRVGENACPFTAGYWAFLQRNEPLLQNNHRMRQPLRGLNRLKDLDALVEQEKARGSRAP